MTRELGARWRSPSRGGPNLEPETIRLDERVIIIIIIKINGRMQAEF